MGFIFSLPILFRTKDLIAVQLKKKPWLVIVGKELWAYYIKFNCQISEWNNCSR